jgi:hypothetical protein
MFLLYQSVYQSEDNDFEKNDEFVIGHIHVYLGCVWFSFLSQIHCKKSEISTKGVQKQTRFSKI